MPNAADTVDRWRQHFKSLNLPEPYVVMAQAHGEEDPRPFGMDAAAGFPPHKWWGLAPVDNGAVRPLAHGYSGQRLSYEEMARSAAEFDPTGYTFFPGVCPSWDNEARKPNRGVTFVGATPRSYGIWLDNACRKALLRQHPEERMVFVNAWNEWAEGTHLEPDRHFGYAYLNETARILSGLTSIESEAKGARNVEQIVPDNTIKQWFRKLAKKGASFFEKLAMLLRSF